MKQHILCLVGLCVWLLALTSPSEAQRGHFFQDGWGGIGHVTDPIIRLGISPETLHKIVRQHAERPEGQTPQVAVLATKLAINDRQVRAALTILGETEAAPRQLAAHLFEIADQFNTLRTMATVQPGDSANVAALKTDARKALEAGDLSKAERLLIDPAARGEIALARLQHFEAAEHFAHAAALVPSTASEDIRIGLLMREADALYRYNEARPSMSCSGMIPCLEKNAKAVYTEVTAVKRYRQLVRLISREHRPLVWAMMQNNLGAAIHRLVLKSDYRDISFYRDGCTRTRSRFCRLLPEPQEVGNEQFETAVAAYREALKEFTRERAPLAWAMTQANLGATLFSLGKRDKGDTPLLEAAVAAYRDALKEFTREQTPGTWAALQGSLAQALTELARRSNNDLEVQKAGIVARREALKEWTRERVPGLWASAQFGLGHALVGLGMGQSGTAKLREAVVAYRESLKETIRTNDHSQVLLIYQILGSVLRTIGERDDDIASLQSAVVSAREALKLFTRKPRGINHLLPGTVDSWARGMGHLWAHNQNILGDALRALGERQAGTTTLEEAATTYRKAIEVWTSGRNSVRWASSRGDEAITLILIAERRRAVSLAETALLQINEAFELIRDHGEPGSNMHNQKLLERARAQLERAKAITERLRRK